MKAHILELQKQIHTIEKLKSSMGDNGQVALKSGAESFDTALLGGLALGQINEFRPNSYLSEPAVFSFASALSGLALAKRMGDLAIICDNYFIHEWGDIYSIGLAAFKIDPKRILLIRPQTQSDLHTCLIETAKTQGIGACIGMFSKKSAPDLAGARKLQLAAAMGGAPCFLLSAFGAPVFAPAHLRLRICSQDFGKASLRASWGVEIEKSRFGARGNFILEYDYARNIMCEPTILANQSFGAPHQKFG